MEVLALVVSLVTLAGVLIGIVVNVSNMVNKRESKAAAEARIEVKLDNIYSEIRGVKDEQSGIKNTLNDHEKRITKVEESTKSAHHRLDRFDRLEEAEKI
jgi:septal ring factor EnvC (AmiA/AmiB activator)